MKDALTATVADTIADWQAKHATMCEHTQIISYGEVAAAVVAKVAETIDAYADRLMDNAVERVMGDKPDGYNAAMRAATVAHVAKALRGEATALHAAREVTG